MADERTITPGEEKILEVAREVVRTYQVWQASMKDIRTALTKGDGRFFDEMSAGERTCGDFYEAVRALVGLVGKGG